MLIILFSIAVVVRSAAAYWIYSRSGTSGWSDAFEYIHYGQQIAGGNWMPQWQNPFMDVGPAIPLLIAFFVLLFNCSIIPFFVYNIIITSLMVPVLYSLSKELFNEKVGWLIALWGLFFVEANKYAPTVLKEPTLLLFFPLTLLLLLKSFKSPKPLKYIGLASLSFSWLIHTDERFFVYLPFLAVLLFLKKDSQITSPLKRACCWSVFVLVLMLPWGIRNYYVFDQMVLLSPRVTAITSKFYGKNFAATSSHFSNDEVRQDLIQQRYARAQEFGEEHGIKPREFGKIEAKVKAFIHFWQPSFIKPTYIQYGYRSQMWSTKHNVASLLSYGFFLPFYLFGFILLIKKKNQIGFYIAFIPVLHSLLHAYMVWPLERYRTPVTFIIVMIGIYAMTELVESYRRQPRQK